MDEFVVKTEPAANGDDDGSPASPLPVKLEIDIEPTVLQPMDIQYSAPNFHSYAKRKAGPAEIKPIKQIKLERSPSLPEREERPRAANLKRRASANPKQRTAAESPSSVPIEGHQIKLEPTPPSPEREGRPRAANLEQRASANPKHRTAAESPSSVPIEEYQIKLEPTPPSPEREERPRAANLERRASANSKRRTETASSSSAPIEEHWNLNSDEDPEWLERYLAEDGEVDDDDDYAADDSIDEEDDNDEDDDDDDVVYDAEEEEEDAAGEQQEAVGEQQAAAQDDYTMFPLAVMMPDGSIWDLPPVVPSPPDIGGEVEVRDEDEDYSPGHAVGVTVTSIHGSGSVIVPPAVVAAEPAVIAAEPAVIAAETAVVVAAEPAVVVAAEPVIAAETAVVVAAEPAVIAAEPAVVIAAEPAVIADEAAVIAAESAVQLSRGRGRGGAAEPAVVTATGRGGRRGRGRRRGGAAWEIGDTLEHAYPRDECIPAVTMTAVAGGRGRGRGRGRGLGGRNIEVGPQSAGEPSEHLPNEVDATDDAPEVAPISFGSVPEHTDFDWQPMESFHGQREEFVPPITGPTQYFDNAYDAFRAIWTDDILDQIVTETNRYAGQGPQNPRYPFKPTNVHEILMLFAFYMLLGIVGYPSIDACYSKSFLLRNTAFQKFFSRARYYRLNSKLHFCNNLTADLTSRSYKISMVVDHLNQKFQALYTPKQNITIDESLTLWKGLLIFKQYLPKKAARFGIKTFELCCSKTSYLWSFFVYTGSQSAEGDRSSVGCPKIISTVLALIRPLLHKGYTLWMDNCFNSPILARFLKRNQTDCVGTLRTNRLHVPKHVVDVPLKKGQYMARACRDMCIVSWQDTRRVTTISTYHGDETEMGPSKGRNDVYKPKVIREYNKFMGGVDKKDQMLEPYHIERRRCQKWYMKLFKRLLNVSILNSRILVEESIGRKLDHMKFRISLIEEIYNRHFSQCPPTRQRQSNANFLPVDDRYNLGLGHWAVPLSASDVDGSGVTEHPIDMTRPNKRKSRNDDQPKAQCIRKRCVHCLQQGRLNNTKSNNRTTLKCRLCNVPLCVYPCFELYHTRTPAPAPN